MPTAGHKSSASGSIDRYCKQQYIVSNNRVSRAVATIAYCATDMLAKVYIDRYLGHQHNLKMTPNKQAIVRTIPFYRHRSIPIG